MNAKDLLARIAAAIVPTVVETVVSAIGRRRAPEPEPVPEEPVAPDEQEPVLQAVVVFDLPPLPEPRRIPVPPTEPAIRSSSVMTPYRHFSVSAKYPPRCLYCGCEITKANEKDRCEKIPM